MDRALLLRHLQQSEAHVALGGRQIERQRKIVAELCRRGADTAAAKHTLALFEDMQVLYVANRDRLLNELIGERQQAQGQDRWPPLSPATGAMSASG